MVTDTQSQNNIGLEKVRIGGENFYKISNSDQMRPFFMSVVSASNHWMFISSNGGLTAGRKNAENALFPYYTDDKITESAEITGSKTILKVFKDDQSHVWEPFSERFDGLYNIQRNLYKNEYGNKILFEEENFDLKLIFRYQWSTSNKFGFVKKSFLINNLDRETRVSFLDGIQNILPYGVNSDLQNRTSNLVDAYKRSELDQRSGLGIFALSAIIVDKAEPSEALKANIAWSKGIDNPRYLLSSLQLNNFRNNLPISQEFDVKAEKGAYFILSDIVLDANSSKDWMIIANVNQTHSSIALLSHQINNEKDLADKVKEDVKLGTKKLIALNAASDGLQFTEDGLKDARHFSNTLFNIMRGGIFDHNYQIEKEDFIEYLTKANTSVYKNSQYLLSNLPPEYSLSELRRVTSEVSDLDFRRLCLEYLPLKFSRRHGDPSRPWNRFTINTHSEIDGSKILDYEGNWRDIFQNWEALSISYPGFLEGMMLKFLNASTFDGYNPYRVTKDGFDWETIEPDDPWSYIGYWGDHQIVYLLKFLELIEEHFPGKLQEYFTKDLFVYAHVPYRIKSYDDIIKNPKDTIVFDRELDLVIRERRSDLGADGALLRNKKGEIHRANFIEKVLITILVKISNFIPEGGIWMNTQRPEWNDANNALVGNGVSMVTLYYLRRFLKFFEELFTDFENNDLSISIEVDDFFNRVLKALEENQHILSGMVGDEDRKIVTDHLGRAGSDYRSEIYNGAFSGEKVDLPTDRIRQFIALSVQYLEHSIDANKREDNLYHAYNLMTVENDKEISIAHLSEMLEGQVAVLSSGYLSSEEAVRVLDALKQSKLFREDQYSYLLYPNKDLPLFLEKNSISSETVESSTLLSEMVRTGNTQIIERDINGVYHFNGNFKNANDLAEMLNSESLVEFSDLVLKEKTKVLQIFEDVFNHKAFTGRSGTFFGYEGLGSIYWHMVSKLQLAVQECCLKAYEEKADAKTFGGLLEHYYEINAGIGLHKSPKLYGAFPTDPYSHTPAGKGAQQPGMTGQVKEDILSRFGELGVSIKNGLIYFDPYLLRKEEFLQQPSTFKYLDVDGQENQITLEAESLCFTYCQIPIVYNIAKEDAMKVIFSDGRTELFQSAVLNHDMSIKVFGRTGDVTRIIVDLDIARLK